MSKSGLIFDAIIGIIVCVIGLILLSTSYQNEPSVLTGNIGNILKALLK